MYFFFYIKEHTLFLACLAILLCHSDTFLDFLRSICELVFDVKLLSGAIKYYCCEQQWYITNARTARWYLILQKKRFGKDVPSNES